MSSVFAQQQQLLVVTWSIKIHIAVLLMINHDVVIFTGESEEFFQTFLAAGFLSHRNLIRLKIVIAPVTDAVDMNVCLPEPELPLNAFELFNQIGIGGKERIRSAPHVVLACRHMEDR